MFCPDESTRVFLFIYVRSYQRKSFITIHDHIPSTLPKMIEISSTLRYVFLTQHQVLKDSKKICSCQAL